jgi:lipopolysaccharide transport system permease protein
MVGHWQPYLALNPVFAVIETIRAPLLGENAGLLVWASALTWTAALMAGAWAFFVRFRGRIAFWV